jgi:hypothetical protein
VELTSAGLASNGEHLVNDPNQENCLSCRALRDQIAALRAELAAYKKELHQRNCNYLETIFGLCAHLRSKENPVTAKRDAAIVRLRNEDSKTWTWARLAREFKMNSDAIRKAYDRQTQEIESFSRMMIDFLKLLPPAHREPWKKRILSALEKLGRI